MISKRKGELKHGVPKSKKFSLLRRHEHAAYFREIRHVVIVSSFRNLRFQIQFSNSIFKFNFPFTVFAFRLVLYFLFINKNSFKPLNCLNHSKTKTLENLSIEPCQGSMALMGASRASRGRGARLSGARLSGGASGGRRVIALRSGPQDPLL